MRRPLFLAIASMGLAAAGVAQELPPDAGTGGGNKKKADIEIELPPGSVKPARSTPVTAAELVQSLASDLATYPAPAGRRAIEQLVSIGPDAIPPLRVLLNGVALAQRVPAALALAALRDGDSLPAIERLLRDPRAVRHAGELLDAVGRIDPVRGTTLALDLAAGRDGKLSGVAFRYLQQHPDPQAGEGVRALLEASSARVREQAFALLEAQSDPGLREHSLRLLGDPSAALCTRASRWLTAHRDETLLRELAACAAEDPPSRRSAWALLTLAEIEEEYSEEAIPATFQDVLAPRLRSGDPLQRVAAALALCHLCVRSEDAAAEELLSERVLPAIMETFLQNRYFEDLLPLLALSRTRVHRVTGLDLGTDLSRWRSAWTGEGDTPLIRRDLPPERLPEVTPELVVRFERRGLLQSGADTEISLAAEGLLEEDAAGELPPRALIVDVNRMRELVQALLDSGLLGRGRRATVDGATSYRMVRLTWDNRERVVVARAEGDEAFDAIEARLLELADMHAWQRLSLAHADDGGAYYRRERERFLASRPSQEWNQDYLHALQVALHTLDTRDRMETLAVLLRRAGMVEALGPEHLTNLLAGLADEPVPEGPCAIVAEAVRRNGDPELRNLTVEFLDDRFGDMAEAPIARLLDRAEAVAAACGHARARVRRIALQCATKAAINPALVLAALDDPDPQVRRAAVFALGAADHPTLRARLLALARGESPALRNVALESLGQVASDEAFAVLSSALNEPGGARRGALQGLARRGGADALSLMAARIEHEDLAAAERQEIVAAIGSSPDPGAGDVLVQLLVSPRLEVQEEAACQLAARGDMRGASILLELVQSPLGSVRALDFLTLLLCADGGARGEDHALRLRNEPYVTAAEWFARAVQAGSVAESADAAPDLPVALLLDALHDERWYVRQNAAGALERTFGVSFGTPYRYLRPEEHARIAERWQRHVDTRQLLNAGT